MLEQQAASIVFAVVVVANFVPLKLDTYLGLLLRLQSRQNSPLLPVCVQLTNFLKLSFIRHEHYNL